MIKRFGIALSLVLISTSVKAQDNYGFYGKKSFIEVSSSTYFPFLYNVSRSTEGQKLSPSGNSLLRTIDRLNFGGRVSIGYAMKSSLGIALEVGYDRYTIYSNVFYTTPYMTSESVRMNSFVFMPRLEFSGANGLLPNGLVHQFGVGLNLNKAVTRNYLRVFSDGIIAVGPNADPAEAEDLMTDFKLDRSVKMIQLMYGLKMRTPIGKSMMLNYGFRYTIDFGYGNDKNTINERFIRDVTRYQFRNLISLELGLTLPF